MNKLRSFLWFILVLELAGIQAELLLEGHTETIWQLVPVLAIALSFLALAWMYVDQRAAPVRAWQALMVLFVVSGFAGFGLHGRGKIERQREADPSFSGATFFWEAMKGESPPAMAPGSMIQLGLLGLTYAYVRRRGRSGALQPAGAHAATDHGCGVDTASTRSDNRLGAGPAEEPGMAANSNAIEQAVSRTLRDNLGKIQRTSDELNQAITDLVSACASSRPANTLAPMLRAQTSAAALSASLEVLARFVTAAMQPPVQLAVQAPVFVPDQPEVARPERSVAAEPVEPAPWPAPSPAATESTPKSAWDAQPAETLPEMPAQPESSQASEQAFESARAPTTEQGVEPTEYATASDEAVLSGTEASAEGEPPPPFVHHITTETETRAEALAEPAAEAPAQQEVFDVSSLSPEEQELHRRAYRVAKVSMQDIKMLRPEDVRLGRENRDLCFRLRDDIDKAYKEYDRRFQPILTHPVDYFYDWMVEILAGGDPQALGEYPYSSPLVRR